MRWNPSLQIGDCRIDEQHRHLFQLLDDLVLSTDDHDNLVMAEAAIGTLREYVTKHLRDEEALLKSVGYKDYAAHCTAHREFEAALDRLTGHMANRPPAEVLSEIEQFVSYWLTEHIATADMRYKPFITG